MEQLPDTTQLPTREQDAKKRDHGTVLVIAGSRQHQNTPAIVGLGALRTGCDIVRIAAPEQSAESSTTFALNLLQTPLDGTRLAPDHVDTILPHTDAADSVVIGPGLGQRDETRNAISKLLAAIECPTVIDADALHTLPAQDTLPETTVLTPHRGEFAELRGEQLAANIAERTQQVETYAAEHSCTVLLKGPEDVVSDGDRTETVAAGNPYMTRGGTGDMLAGIAAALLAQAVDAFDSAYTAAAVNGCAGERALEQYGPGFLLEELLQEVSQVWHENN